MGRQRTNYTFSNVPKDWNDITLKQFQDLSRLYKSEENISDAKLIAFFTNCKEDYVKDAPVAVISEVMNYLSFINTSISDEVKNTITYEEYTYKINSEEELKFGEYVDVQTVLQNDSDNFAAVLGIICRKENEVYDDDFISMTLPNRIEMFENMPITNVQPLINFFLKRSLALMPIILQSSVKEQINQLVSSTETFLKNGGGKKHSILSRMKTQRKLKKYKKCISQLS